MTYRKLEKVAEASCGVQQNKKIKLTPKKRFDLNYKIKHFYLCLESYIYINIFATLTKYFCFIDVVETIQSF